MNLPNLTLATKIEATRGVLRPSETLPRPIPCPPENQIGPIGGARPSSRPRRRRYPMSSTACCADCACHTFAERRRR